MLSISVRLRVDRDLILPASADLHIVVSLQIYPYNIFNFFLAVGIYLVRWRRKKADLPRASFKAWDVAVVFNILTNIFLIVMPWYPPAAGRNGGNVSFWYGSSTATGCGM